MNKPQIIIYKFSLSKKKYYQQIIIYEYSKITTIHKSYMNPLKQLLSTNRYIWMLKNAYYPQIIIYEFSKKNYCPQIIIWILYKNLLSTNHDIWILYKNYYPQIIIYEFSIKTTIHKSLYMNSL